MVHTVCLALGAPAVQRQYLQQTVIVDIERCVSSGIPWQSHTYQQTARSRSNANG